VTVYFIFSANDDGRVMIDSMCEIWSSHDYECQYCFLWDVMPSELVDRNKLEGPSAFIFCGMRMEFGCWYLSANLHTTPYSIILLS